MDPHRLGEFMKRLFLPAAFAALVTAPCIAPAQSPMSGPASGVGPHGWDYYIGTWTGTYYNAASGTATHLRDTYTTLNPGHYTDLTQMNIGSGWKTTASSTCTTS
jgi:hypothetical protein